MYSKGREKEEKIKKLQTEKLEQMKKKELENCTFKPKINYEFNLAKESVLTDRKKMTIYERQILWNDKKSKK
jgi:hypothetical protein